MSNQVDPSSVPLDIQTIQTIDQLNLSSIQKHHVRILAHCLAILKTKFTHNDSFDDRNFLKEWCDSQSKQFNDQKFSDLLFEQLESAEKKLNIFSQTIGKNVQDLEIEDLVILVRDN